MFLDEPTSGVDPITRRQFWELIYEAAHAGTTVLVTTHYMDEAEYCDRISIMVAGRIDAMGTPAELKQQFGVGRFNRRGFRAPGAADERTGGKSVNALWRPLRKETYHILRDRRTLTVLIFMPVVQVVLFGFSIRTDVDNVRLAIVDPVARRDDAGDSRPIRRDGHVSRSRCFQRARSSIRSSRRTPRRSRSSSSPASGTSRVAADGADHDRVRRNGAEHGIGAQAYVTAVIQRYDNERQQRRGSVRIVPQVRARFNPTRESTNLFVPGLMAMVLTIISALMTALSLTREKETGTMEALLVSPLKPWQIIIGKVAPYLVIGFISVLWVLVEARLVFHVPMRGSMTLLLAEGMLFILVALVARNSRLGAHVIAARRDDGGDARHDAADQLLSGFIFPIESMPRVLQWLSNIVPAKWFVLDRPRHHAERRRVDYLWHETLILAAMTASASRRERALVPRASAMSSSSRFAIRRALALAPRCCTSCAIARRSRRSLVLPSIQLLILSNVTTFAIRRPPVYVVDFDRTSASRGARQPV